MFINAATLALAFASGANAHALMHGVWVNGVDQGDGRNVYIRTPPNNSPVKDLASPDLACNVNGAKAASSFVKAAAGDSLTFEWLHNTRGDDIIDGSHKGPIITYIAPYTEGNGADAIWTKIAEDGYDSTTKKWAVDKLIAAKGMQDFVLPANLAAGQYLIRQEIIALHESDTAFNVNSARGAQFYPSWYVKFVFLFFRLGVPAALCASRHLQRLCSPPHPDAPIREEITDIVGQRADRGHGLRHRRPRPGLQLQHRLHLRRPGHRLQPVRVLLQLPDPRPGGLGC
jgi:hypothetical protein